ncbi:MAG: DUF6442 family protein [Oscillospiraceae bacterium]|nr:DUF6442 family protein [Oscillospiraceae bacterium]
MDKNEILRKAQSKKANTPDEMELQVVQKGNGIALGFVLIFCGILMFAKMYAKQPWYDVYSICFISIGVQHLYKSRKLHQKHELVLGILYTVLAVVMVCAYCWNIVR